MESVPLDIDDELRVLTGNSVWLIRPDAYCRMPRREEPRHVPGRELADGVWHPHVGAWLVTDALGSCIRLLPPGRPYGASGIVTGAVLRSEPPLEALCEVD